MEYLRKALNAYRPLVFPCVIGATISAIDFRTFTLLIQPRGAENYRWKAHDSKPLAPIGALRLPPNLNRRFTVRKHD
jgi:hypothetical protein